MSIASTKNSNTRNISETDKFFRDTITVTANARNIGLDQWSTNKKKVLL